MRKGGAFGAAISIVALSNAAFAQPTPEDEALAEELFREGKRLVGEAQYDKACPKLAESYRLDPGGGTLLTLALCREAQGLTASAWADFTDAITLAKRDGRADREAIAREHADALVPKLRRLRVRVTSPSPDLVVSRDGAPIGQAAWNVAAPVDPGDHVIEASAPGHAVFRKLVSVSEEGASLDVEVPALVPVTIDVPTQPERPEVRPSSTTLRWISFAVAGVGLAAGGAGTFFALDAKSKRDDANAKCPTNACADPTAVDASRSAGRSADWATASFVVGGGLLATAAVLFVLSLDKR